LTLWYVAIFATAQVVFGGLMWVTLRHHLYEIVDDTLRDQSEDLQNFLQAQKKDATIEKMRDEVGEEYGGEHAGEYLELYDEQGSLIFRSEGMGPEGAMKEWPAATVKGVLVNRKLGEKPMRFRLSLIPAQGHVYQARIGTAIWEVKKTLAAFQRYLWMLAPLLLAVAAGVGYWLSRRALAPVDRLTQAARSIGGGSLGNRLDVAKSGDELERLADTLNGMLDRIETSFRRITEFTADASHELRTPVSLMRTEAEVALRRSRNPEEYRAALEHILGEAERTTRLLEQLLALARTDAGREFLEFRDLDLRLVVEQAADAWGGVVRAKELNLRFELGEAAVAVHGDEAALRRVADILLDNAVKFAKVQGTITLSLRSEEGSVVMAVQDDGIGIAPEEQKKIFERFYRVDKARNRSHGGAGLGLAIARWIVEQHRGTITVDSADGKGSRFEVRLPEAVVAGKAPERWVVEVAQTTDKTF
jgi:heavy metal sensor kinase